MEKLKKFYISPQVLVYEIDVESGFAQSSTSSNQITPPSWDVEDF